MLPQRAAVDDIDTDTDLIAEANLASRDDDPAEQTTQTTPAIVVPTRRQRRAAQQLQARKVGRIVRHVDPFSVLRVASVFYLCVLLTVTVASLFLWALAANAGIISGIEDFIRQAMALESFKFDANKLFKLEMLGGSILWLVASVATALGAVVFNFIADLTGGLRVTVVEEESARLVSARSPAPRV